MRTQIWKKYIGREIDCLCPTGKNIDEHLLTVYEMFNFKKNGGKRKSLCKKLKFSNTKTRKNKQNMELLFVYGSLRKGFHNHALLNSAKFIGDAITVDNYYMVGRLNHELDPFEDGRTFDYPRRQLLHPYIFTDNIRDDMISTKIIGEVYSIPNHIIKELDLHEGHPTIYRRSIIEVYMNNKKMYANVYLLMDSIIKSDIQSNKYLYIPIEGDWKETLTTIYKPKFI
jgi:gamma-glutamylaminecyclotransferase